MQPAYEIPMPPRGEDLPWDGGEPMESDRHRMQMELLLESLQGAWAGRDDYYAGGNMAVYFSAIQAKRTDFRAPDVFVVMGAEPRERRSWVAWEEDGKLPDVIIEITSPSTEKADRGEKLRIYERVLRLPIYAIFDPFSAALEVYAYARRGAFDPVPPDDRGVHPCEVMGLGLAVRDGTFRGVTCPWLRWVDEAGNVLPSDEERAATEHARAEAASARADAQAAENERLRALLLAAGVDPAAR